MIYDTLECTIDFGTFERLYDSAKTRTLRTDLKTTLAELSEHRKAMGMIRLN